MSPRKTILSLSLAHRSTLLNGLTSIWCSLPLNSWFDNNLYGVNAVDGCYTDIGGHCRSLQDHALQHSTVPATLPPGKTKEVPSFIHQPVHSDSVPLYTKELFTLLYTRTLKSASDPYVASVSETMRMLIPSHSWIQSLKHPYSGLIFPDTDSVF